MSPEDYLRSIRPDGLRSKLDPHLASIHVLLAAGCSIRQVQDFLAKNGVDTNVSTIRRFIKSRPVPPARLTPASSAAPSNPPVTPTKERATTEPIPPTQTKPSPTDRPRFPAPPDPMDAVRHVRKLLADKAASKDSNQGEHHEDRGSE